MNQPIYLNVGGYLYTTTYQTLTKYPGSLLERMFNLKTQYNFIFDEHRNIFIDRNGKIFKHILNFLRDNIVPDKKYLKDFTIEMKYFGLPLDRRMCEKNNPVPFLDIEENKLLNDCITNIEFEKFLGKKRHRIMNVFVLTIIEKKILLNLIALGYNVTYEDNGVYINF